MKLFSIKELEKFSGVKAHTIRMWEKRYGIINPKRSSGNTRHYTLTDVRQLLDIAFLNHHGYKISHLATMNADDIQDKLSSPGIHDLHHAKEINRMIVSMFAGDIEMFETMLDSCVAALGIDKTINQLIVPFLEKVNMLSYKDKSPEAHFVVTAVRKKIILGIETATTYNALKKTALLFLPAGEHYDLLLLYITYVVKCTGIKILYLGTDISLDNIMAVSNRKRPEILYTYITPGKTFHSTELASYLESQLPSSKLFVATTLPVTHSQCAENNIQYFYYKDVHQIVEQSSIL